MMLGADEHPLFRQDVGSSVGGEPPGRPPDAPP
jgi:hypothetical protein